MNVSDLCPFLLCTFHIDFARWYGARCSSVVRAFTHGAMGRRIDPSCGGPIELLLVPAKCSTTGVTKAVVCVILSMG